MVCFFVFGLGGLRDASELFNLPIFSLSAAIEAIAKAKTLLAGLVNSCWAFVGIVARGSLASRVILALQIRCITLGDSQTT